MSNQDFDIFREISENFAVVPNFVTEQRRLSSEAVALYAYIMGKAPGWRPTMRDVRQRFHWGRERQQRAMRELQAEGFARPLLITDDEGKIVASTYLFRDRPRDKPTVKARDKYGSPLPGSIEQKPEVRRRSEFNDDAILLARYVKS